MLRKLLEKAFLLKARWIKDELSQALIQATTEDNWQASTTVLHKIAALSYDEDNWPKIRTFIQKYLKNKDRWKKLIKAMHIVQFLLKNGSERVINHYKYQIQYIRTLQNFQLMEDEIDRGAAIRERAKVIVQLLQDDQLLQDERIKAKKIRERMSQSSGSTSYSSDSFNREGFPAQVKSSGYDNYYSRQTQKKSKDSNSKKQDKEEQDSSYLQEYFSGQQQSKKNQHLKEMTDSELQQQHNSNEQTQAVHSAQLKRKQNERLNKNQDWNKPKKYQMNINVQSMKTDLSLQQQYYNQYHLKGRQNKLSNNKNQKISKISKQSVSPYQLQCITSEKINNINTPQTSDIDLLQSLDGVLFMGTQSASQSALQNNHSSQNNSISSQIIDSNTNTSQQNFIPLYTNNSYQQQQPNISYNNEYSSQNGYQSNSYTNSYNPSPYAYYQQPYQVDSRSNNISYNVPSSYSAPNNPYLNIPPSVLSQISSISSYTPQKEVSKQNHKQNISQNPANMKNIKWMSNTEKNLTDLSDLNVQIKTVPKQPSKNRQEFTNHIKIDQWAW